MTEQAGVAEARGEPRPAARAASAPAAACVDLVHRTDLIGEVIGTTSRISGIIQTRPRPFDGGDVKTEAMAGRSPVESWCHALALRGDLVKIGEAAAQKSGSWA